MLIFHTFGIFFLICWNLFLTNLCIRDFVLNNKTAIITIVTCSYVSANFLKIICCETPFNNNRAFFVHLYLHKYVNYTDTGYFNSTIYNLSDGLEFF
jgi:hypothetical protein